VVKEEAVIGRTKDRPCRGSSLLLLVYAFTHHSTLRLPTRSPRLATTLDETSLQVPCCNHQTQTML
jgi:hypothetical protein